MSVRGRARVFMIWLGTCCANTVIILCTTFLFAIWKHHSQLQLFYSDHASMSATQPSADNDVIFLDYCDEQTPHNESHSSGASSAVGILHCDHEDATFPNYLYVKTFNLRLNSILIIGSILAKFFLLSWSDGEDFDLQEAQTLWRPVRQTSKGKNLRSYIHAQLIGHRHVLISSSMVNIVETLKLMSWEDSLVHSPTVLWLGRSAE